MVSKTRAPKMKPAKNYRHPESESPMRPEVGTQAQFKKRLPPKTYRYDTSLSPTLNWDGKNPAREQSMPMEPTDGGAIIMVKKTTDVANAVNSVEQEFGVGSRNA